MISKYNLYDFFCIFYVAHSWYLHGTSYEFCMAVNMNFDLQNNIWMGHKLGYRNRIFIIKKLINYYLTFHLCLFVSFYMVKNIEVDINPESYWWQDFGTTI
jgi:hypothetical protein